MTFSNPVKQFTCTSRCWNMLWCAHQDNLLHACLFHSGWRLGYFPTIMRWTVGQVFTDGMPPTSQPWTILNLLTYLGMKLTVPGEHREDEDVCPWAGAKSPDRLWQQGHWFGITLRHYVCLLGSAVCSSEILKTPLYISYSLDMHWRTLEELRQPWKNAHLSMCREGIMCPKHSKTTGPHPEYRQER